MFAFGNPFDPDVEKATNEKNTAEDWGLILEICDKVGQTPANSKNCLKSIVKRLNNADPHVVLKAITLLDACVNNCGRNFHLEVASREFETDFRKLITKSHPTVQQKLKELLKTWADGEFKSDPQLNIIPSLYNKLKLEGIDFNPSADMVAKKSPQLSKDPNVASNQQEVEDIAKAIELSLKEKGGSPRTSTATSLYPSTSLSAAAAGAAGAPSDARKVRALYDFEAAEDNELTFLAGEIIHVIDDSDQNWWKGYNQRGEGLFPANFVSADLSVEPEQLKVEQNKKSVQFQENAAAKTVETKPEDVEINEGKIDRLLHLLHEADPSDAQHDTHEMLNLEEQVNNMGPLIDAELERVDRKHAQLTQLSSDLVEALNLYHTLMREPQYSTLPKPLPYAIPPQMNHTHLPAHMYNGGMPPHGVGHQFPGNPYATMMPHDRPPFMGLPPGAPPMSFPPNFQIPPPGMGPPPGALPSGGPMPPHGVPTDERPPTSMPPQFTQAAMPNYGPPSIQPPPPGHPFPPPGQTFAPPPNSQHLM
ncbi:Signal transducing adaptor molecule [Carabus blaptoides fortunei]